LVRDSRREAAAQQALAALMESVKEVKSEDLDSTECLGLLKQLTKDALERLPSLEAGSCDRRLGLELGRVLRASLAAASAASRDFAFDASEPFRRAAAKVKRRTPYMSEWGDGSLAHTPEEARNFWLQRKAGETPGMDDVTMTTASHNSPGDLLFVVERLTDPRRCPWTRTHTAKALLRFLLDEIEEVSQEVAVLSAAGAGGAGQLAHFGALASELGDLLFNALMAIYLAARDYGLDAAALMLEAAGESPGSMARSARCPAVASKKL
ncbi:unnamed protein product, partial [Polarella glacialis]